uniref:ATPase, T2SS/T4P/T4SS family n=1 Tax=Cupriavidus gilardii TaxID=82541 RepID=UPI00247889F4|nr:ATPase, T2SS/T4P/T4SS family [Cupriavidus gilardii]WDE72709.1 hypothetical protein [Cupriavidus gilardii]
MLKRLFTGTDGRESAFALALPAAAPAVATADDTGRDKVVAMEAGGETPAANAAATSALVTALADIGAYRSLIDVVPEQWRDKCVALDVMYNSVRLVCADDFFGTAPHNTVLSILTSRRFSIEREVRATERVIAELRAEALRSHRPTIVTITDESRNLQLYDDLIRGAFQLKASDIHFRMTRSGPSHLMLRRFGKAVVWKTFPDSKVLIDAISAGFQARTRPGSNSSGAFNPENAMNTMTEHIIDEVNVNARLSSQPQNNKGSGVVIRLLPAGMKGGRVPTLHELGYAPSHVKQIIAAISRKGIVLVSGGTGAGKSTSLRSKIYAIPNFHSKIIRSVEEPVEYEIEEPNVNQVSIQTNPDDDPEAVRRKYNAALKQALRLDPDVLMASEVRDREAASMVLEAALTGHLSLTTMHGNGCIDQLLRASLPRIGMDAAILGALNTLALSSYQAILPMLCQQCCLEANKVLSREKQRVLEERFGLDVRKVRCANPEGCAACWNKELGVGGYAGQTIAVELYSPSPEHRPLIRAEAWDELETAWRQSRRASFVDADMTGKTAMEHAIYKVAQGLIDPRDVEAEFEPLETYRIVGGQHA